VVNGLGFRDRLAGVAAMCDSTVGLVLPGRNVLPKAGRMSRKGSSSRAASSLDAENDFI